MAGADRVEGTLFGNGERTGNVDVVTLALNLFSQGIDPGLDDHRHRRGRAHRRNTATSCRCIRAIPMPASWSTRRFRARTRTRSRRASTRSQSATTISGRCRICRSTRRISGRSYEAVIRVNSQSGKGGVAYVLKADHGLDLPRGLQIEFSRIVQEVADRTGKELTSRDIWSLFQDTYLRRAGRASASSITACSRSRAPASAASSRRSRSTAPSAASRASATGRSPRSSTRCGAIAASR